MQKSLTTIWLAVLEPLPAPPTTDFGAAEAGGWHQDLNSHPGLTRLVPLAGIPEILKSPGVA